MSVYCHVKGMEAFGGSIKAEVYVFCSMFMERLPQWQESIARDALPFMGDGR